MDHESNLITLEGIDGSGKSTLVDALSASDIGLEPEQLCKTQEPTDDSIGRLIREQLSDDSFGTLAELHLFIADHAHHLNTTIDPALQDGKTILCDRYFDSRIAYQAVGLNGIGGDLLTYIYDLHRPWTKDPDLTILIDTDPAVAIDRLSTAEKFEIATVLEEIRENYLELAKRHGHRFEVVDGNQSPEAVKEEASAIIQSHIRSTT